MSDDRGIDVDDDDRDPEVVFIKAKTAKQIKAEARPEFAANPDKFYPTSTLRELGFSRASCPECKNNFWKHDQKKITCGDSQCEKKYGFIGVGTGIGRKGPDSKKITYAEAWESFRRSLTTADVPCTAIPRYPVVARWRADVDYVAAGIFCFQPYCVTGELEPPANPLICPQFCLRFNDLDNIGLTGRHYSGFIMLGIQVFNTPGNYKFWNHECVRFNYRWLTEELKINPDEITFIEDVWAGGGNLGPSIEYFVSGLELGNMVFMQYKTFPDGHREELAVQVIDVGIGLERVPWLINGSATSYCDVFPTALDYFLKETKLEINSGIWEQYGPLSCLLNVDEVEDIEKTWQWIADKIGQPKDLVKASIEPIRDVYLILDHTRCSLMAIYDGSLPSNVGGAANVRNILRRVFALLEKRGWMDIFKMEGLLHIFECHKKDLATIYGPFQPYPSFNPIIELEYERWKFTDTEQRAKLQKLLKKTGTLGLEEWITVVTAWGIPADTVAKETKQPIPGNLWLQIAERQEGQVKAEAAVLYSTVHLTPTVSTYYKEHKAYDFDATILEVMPNVEKKNTPSIVILDRSAFYPTSGGQENDTGVLVIEGITYQVVDVMKVGPCVLHVVDPPLPARASLAAWKDVKVSGTVNEERRTQLRNNHTATHIVYASCRKVLGPHVWQHGAKKTTLQAHLDITHFKSVTPDQVIAIETEANRVVMRCREITKGFMPKDVAEKKYGFHLYQGGVVPGNELRVVNIEHEDTEACCGTHADNTAEVGTIKIIKVKRTSDGIVRFYFVAGERALQKLNEATVLLNSIATEWKVSKDELGDAASRFFNGYKTMGSLVSKQTSKILALQMKVHLLEPESKLLLGESEESNATLFISNMPQYAADLKKSNKGVVFVGPTFFYGICLPAHLDLAKLNELLSKMTDDHSKALEEAKSKASADATPAAAGDKKKKVNELKTKDKIAVKTKAKGKAAVVDGIIEFFCLNHTSRHALNTFFAAHGFKQSEA